MVLLESIDQTVFNYILLPIKKIPSFVRSLKISTRTCNVLVNSLSSQITKERRDEVLWGHGKTVDW